MLSHWDPFSELNRIQDALLRTRAVERPEATFRPAVDIREDQEAYVVYADLAGVDPKDVDIDVEKGVLTLRGERRPLHEDAREGYHRVERVHGAFSRSFQLPESVDVEAIQAEMKNGVLTLRLPKSGKAAPRKVQVRQAD